MDLKPINPDLSRSYLSKKRLPEKPFLEKTSTNFKEFSSHFFNFGFVIYKSLHLDSAD